MGKVIEKINKLSLPATILIASLVLGGFYYAAEINKQRSIERQQENKFAEERKAEGKKALDAAFEVAQKKECVNEAEISAAAYYKSTCTYDCKEGRYSIASYEHYLETCLERAGLQ